MVPFRHRRYGYKHSLVLETSQQPHCCFFIGVIFLALWILCFPLKLIPKLFVNLHFKTISMFSCCLNVPVAWMYSIFKLTNSVLNLETLNLLMRPSSELCVFFSAKYFQRFHFCWSFIISILISSWVLLAAFSMISLSAKKFLDMSSLNNLSESSTSGWYLFRLNN